MDDQIVVNRARLDRIDGKIGPSASVVVSLRREQELQSATPLADKHVEKAHEMGLKSQQESRFATEEQTYAQHSMAPESAPLPDDKDVLSELLAQWTNLPQ